MDPRRDVVEPSVLHETLQNINVLRERLLETLNSNLTPSPINTRANNIETSNSSTDGAIGAELRRVFRPNARRVLENLPSQRASPGRQLTLNEVPRFNFNAMSSTRSSKTSRKSICR